MARSSKYISAREAKELDVLAREKFNISTLILMENAGKCVAQEALEMLGKKKEVAIFCGTGNNGGDGFVAARHILAAGKQVKVFLAGSRRKVKNEAKVNLGILLKLRQHVSEVKRDNLNSTLKAISGSPLVIDALLGVGLEGEVREPYRALIEMINNHASKVLSVDIPSGLDATSGKVLGKCVKADRTVTFMARKRGMRLGKGGRYCGKIVVKDLGIPL